jgi:hypothetical protein
VKEELKNYDEIFFKIMLLTDSLIGKTELMMTSVSENEAD